MVCRDYEELFKTLNAFKIKYLVVGAHAVIYYTKPRYTKDLDVWVPADLNEPKKVYQALKSYGAPLKGMKPADFCDKSVIYQIGVAPVRIDIMVNVGGVSIAEAWKNRQQIRYGRAKVFVLGKKDLIQAKEFAGRPEDLIDLKQLRKTLKR